MTTLLVRCLIPIMALLACEPASAQSSDYPSRPVSVIACMVIISRWNDGGRGWTWAFAGFALSVVLCILIPVTQSLVQQWATDGSHSMVERASILSVVGIFWSVMRAVSYGLLLMGLIAGRPGAAV